MVGPLRCHGDSTSICMHIVSMHLICAAKILEKQNKKFKLNFCLSHEVVCGFDCSLPLEGAQMPWSYMSLIN